jgi:hypothetical protein
VEPSLHKVLADVSKEDVITARNIPNTAIYFISSSLG